MRGFLQFSLPFSALLLGSCSSPTETFGPPLTPPATVWSLTIPGADPSYGCALDHTADGGFILTGQDTLFRLWTAKINPAGVTEWEAAPLPTWNCGGNDIHQLSDGGYIITGGIGSLGGTDNVILLKTDANGNFKTVHEYGGQYFDCGYDVAPIPSGGFVIAGVTETYGAGGGDAWVIRTDSVGNALWSIPFGDIWDDEANRVQVTSGGAFVVAGTRYSPESAQNNYSFWLLKLSGNGSPLWTHTYTPGPDLKCWGLVSTSDGGFVLGGTYGSQIGAPGGTAHIKLIKVDSLGNQEWIQAYTGGTQLIGSDLALSDHGGFFVTGYALDVSEGEDLFLMETDAQGTALWQTFLGGDGDDRGTGVVATFDGACAASGFTTPLGGSDPQFWLVKMAAN